MTDQIFAVMAQIIRSTFVACVDTRADVRQAIEVSDALLAAPVLAVAFAGAEALVAVQRRHGSNLVTGAWNVMDLAGTEETIAAGASFVVCQDCNDAVLQRCARAGVLAIPTVSGPDDLALASAFDLPICRASLLSVAGNLFQDQPNAYQPHLMVTGWNDERQLAACAEVGATLAEWMVYAEPQAAIIRRARDFRRVWEDSLQAYPEDVT
ncbi:MAG: hypothetical protein KDI07_15365 [Anaerolineae bacterium]|nr:hypothetical protein [Anaerolineae bacterium]MCB0249953.1 hypothetical protein [Anaerolineae bacterium]